jgi:hypothetical protein
MRRLILLSALVFAAVAPANAQDGVAEFTPIIGFRLGGSLQDADTGETHSIQPSWSWGVVAGIAVGPPNRIVEATYLQQLTRASSDIAFGGGLGGLHDMRIQKGTYVAADGSAQRGTFAFI